MKDFKLIAIRPLEGCNENFLKVLSENEIYNFYNDYKFILSDDKRNVINIEHIPTIPDDLYKTNNNHNYHLNISAVVGKNGSGKSTLTELLFAAIYNLAVNKDILKGEDDEILELIENIKVQIFYSLDSSIYSLNVNTGSRINDNIDSQIDLNSISIEDKSENRSFKLVTTLEDNKALFYDFFFYTVAINYSIYSLNSLHIGDWIYSLFHKNDGYTTPVVINPMRTEGKFDINLETYLVKQRLLSNILEPIKPNIEIRNTLRNLAENKIVTGIKLKYNYKKLEKQEPKYKENLRKYNKNLYEGFDLIYKKYFGLSEFVTDQNKETVSAIFYIVNKMIKICENYPNYKKYIARENNIDFENLIPKLLKDNSHITFKLKQALNYIHYRFYIDYQNHNSKTYEIENLSLEIKNLKDHNKDLEKDTSIIELLPPPFFDIELIINNASSFDDLSSGEKQKIYSTSTIVYHILNLNSVSNNQDEEETSRFKYKYVNILFDEVELYFHPDLQRTFISDLISYMDKINPFHIEHIRGINICFITHSPFILSDIPSQNIIFLEVDKDTNKAKQIKSDSETYGANIHDLLKHNFFLENGYMGEFVKNKIVDLVKFFNEDLNPNEVPIETWDKEKSEKFITLVGEPVIKERLMILFDKKFHTEDKKSIELRIKSLQNELKKKDEKDTNK